MLGEELKSTHLLRQFLSTFLCTDYEHEDLRGIMEGQGSSQGLWDMYILKGIKRVVV